MFRQHVFIFQHGEGTTVTVIATVIAVTTAQRAKTEATVTKVTEVSNRTLKFTVEASGEESSQKALPATLQND